MTRDYKTPVQPETDREHPHRDGGHTSLTAADGTHEPELPSTIAEAE